MCDDASLAIPRRPFSNNAAAKKRQTKTTKTTMMTKKKTSLKKKSRFPRKTTRTRNVYLKPCSRNGPCLLPSRKTNRTPPSPPGGVFRNPRAGEKKERKRKVRLAFVRSRGVPRVHSKTIGVDRLVFVKRWMTGCLHFINLGFFVFSNSNFFFLLREKKNNFSLSLSLRSVSSFSFVSF